MSSNHARMSHPDPTFDPTEKCPPEDPTDQAKEDEELHKERLEHQYDNSYEPLAGEPDPSWMQ